MGHAVELAGLAVTVTPLSVAPGVSDAGTPLKLNDGVIGVLNPFTTRVNAILALFCGVLLSVTVTVNVYVPGVVGTPLIVPVPDDKLNPPGSVDPPLAAHFQVRGAVPFSAVNVAE
jgi:hypothetical protein